MELSNEEYNKLINIQQKRNWLSENIAFIIDLIVVGVWAAMTVYIIAKFLGIIKAQVGVDFSGVLGIYAGVTGLATQVLSFHRGSSRGSEDKSKQIENLTKANIDKKDIA